MRSSATNKPERWAVLLGTLLVSSALHAQTGKDADFLDLLAQENQVFSASRYVQTIAETVPGFEAIAWLGVAAPPKTPRDIVTKLHEQLKLIAAEPEYAAKLRNIGLEPAASASPEQFRSWLMSQKEYWGKVVRDSKIPLAD